MGSSLTHRTVFNPVGFQTEKRHDVRLQHVQSGLGVRVLGVEVTPTSGLQRKHLWQSQRKGQPK